MGSQSLDRFLPYLQHKYAINGVTALLLILLCYLLASMTWKLMPAGEAELAQWQPDREHMVKATPASMRGLISHHLFGNADLKPSIKKPVVRNTNARKTALNVTLTGIVSSSEQGGGLAIIESRGKQGTYGVGETIDGTQAKVEAVSVDRVILDNRGQSEYLMLDGVNKPGSSDKRRVNKPARTKSGAATKDLKGKVEELRKNPGKLTDYLNISPVRKNGAMQGYRLNPGREKLFFTEFDLKPNDLAVAFNGFDLTDSSQAMSVMKELSNLTEASITVERDGQLHEIFIQLP